MNEEIAEDRDFYWSVARCCYAVTCCWALLGILTNGIILMTTIRTKSLRSTCNLLIGLCAVADIFHLFGALMQLPMVFNFDARMSSDACRIIIFLPEMGVAVGCVCILCVGMDRLFSIHASIKYRSVDKRIYYSGLVLLMVAYCSYITSLMIIFHRPQVLYCEIISPFHDAGIEWFSRAHLTVIFTTVVVYLAVWISLRSRPEMKEMKRLVRSLLIIASVDVGGWILTPGITQFVLALHLPDYQFFAAMQFAVIFINAALSVKFFIYYLTSTDYRAAFRFTLFKEKAFVRISQVSVTEVKSRRM